VLNGNFYGFDDLLKGELCYFRRELHDAELHLKQALSKARERSQYDIQNRSMLYLMNIAFVRGDYSAANKQLQSMKELLNETGCAIRCAATYDISCGLFHLMLGQPDQVPDWLKGDFGAYTHPAFLDNYANLVKAKYHYQSRQYSTLLAFIENDWERQAILLGKIEFKVLEALSLYQIKRRDEAIAALSQAYSLADPNSIIMPLIQYGKDMRTLTSAALRDKKCSIPKTWLENINRKASAFAKKQGYIIAENNPAVINSEGITLTNREIKVLQDLAQGLSRTEIAANQDISINTVKMIVNIIYEKLHASSLVDAVRIAMDRKII
jgi:LuxR family maltose regulon positive regulatory protein